MLPPVGGEGSLPPLDPCNDYKHLDGGDMSNNNHDKRGRSI